MSCKMLLHCKRDELRKLWIEGIEHKHVLQLLDEIESIKQVPQRLDAYMASKHYLHATDMLVSTPMKAWIFRHFHCMGNMRIKDENILLALDITKKSCYIKE